MSLFYVNDLYSWQFSKDDVSEIIRDNFNSLKKIITEFSRSKEEQLKEMYENEI